MNPLERQVDELGRKLLEALKVNEALLTENAGLTDEISGYMRTNRTQSRQIGALSAELRKLSAADPRSADIQTVLVNWQNLTGRKRAAIDPSTKRWRMVATALKREHGVQGMDGQERCIHAVEGVALLPYVGTHGRQAHGKPSRRYDDVQYALGDESMVERALKYRAVVLGACTDDLVMAWEQAGKTLDLYATIVMRRFARQEIVEPQANVIPIRKEAA